MTNYAQYNTLTGELSKAQCKCLNEEVINIVITDEVYENFDQYIYDGEIVLNPDYEELLAAKERSRLDSLSLTAADVERAIYKAKGIDFDDVIETVEAMNEAGTADIDIKALKIELKANNFYRGNDYVEQIGTLLGYSSDDLDYLFENGTLPE